VIEALISADLRIYVSAYISIFNVNSAIDSVYTPPALRTNNAIVALVDIPPVASESFKDSQNPRDRS